MTQTPDVITVDFETEAIASRPAYPPVPVGVAIKWPHEPGYYVSWGHPSGTNNATLPDALRELHRVWDSGLPVLFHNAKFDLAVAYEKLRMPVLPWDRVHDTMFLAFLVDPHATKLGLKDLAADWLNMPPDERDAIKDWVWAQRSWLEATYGAKVVKTKTGAWIAKCPGTLVEPYAIGDVERTAKLYEYAWPIVQRHGMGTAYNRERQLLPILMANECVGMRVSVYELEHDTARYSAGLLATETWLREELNAAGLNFDADEDVANVLLQRGIVLPENWQKTKTGRLSVKKDVLLPEHFTDPRIASALGYRNRLKTCLTMFMQPWLEQASKRGGYISTNWNQVRDSRGGTRTGRPSTDHPNFLNISKTWEDKGDGYVHPEFLNVEALPLVRKYVLPDDGGVFLHRDFDGQELRVFAHFECGALQAEYIRNPETDPHAFVGAKLREAAGRDFTRTQVKNMNFQAMYGGGVTALSGKLKVSYAEAKKVKQFHDKALPGRKDLNDAIKAVVNHGDPIRTWGGRLYYPEDPKVVDGQRRDFVYKLINYLIQGSAADLTKQALIDWHAAGPRSRFLVTVYDEADVSAPAEYVKEEMALLKEVMEAKRLDVPMLSSGKAGPSWGLLEKYID